MYDVVDVYRRVFLTSALGGGESQYYVKFEKVYIAGHIKLDLVCLHFAFC
jgi:hypothetical protein